MRHGPGYARGKQTNRRPRAAAASDMGHGVSEVSLSVSPRTVGDRLTTAMRKVISCLSASRVRRPAALFTPTEVVTFTLTTQDCDTPDAIQTTVFIYGYRYLLGGNSPNQRASSSLHADMPATSRVSSTKRPRHKTVSPSNASARGHRVAADLRILPKPNLPPGQYTPYLLAQDQREPKVHIAQTPFPAFRFGSIRDISTAATFTSRPFGQSGTGRCNVIEPAADL